MRNRAVDNLRGISALMVAGTHALLVQSIGGIDNIWQHTLLDPLAYDARIIRLFYALLNGNLAVMIFMVISGWALSQSSENKILNIWRFYQKRVIRIVPVYWVTTLFLILMIYTGIAPTIIENAGTWWGWWLKEKVGWEMILRHLLFIDPGLGGSSWTMQPIVVGSLLFPFIYPLLKQDKQLKRFGLLILTLLLGAWVTQKDQYFLLAAFGGGMGLALYCNKSGKKSNLLVGIIIGLGLLIRAVWQARMAWIVEGIAAYTIVKTVLEINVEFLNTKSWITLIGRISYSFYLWHFVVLYLLTPIVLPFLGGGWVGIILNGVVSMIVTIPVAWVSYLVVEKNIFWEKYSEKHGAKRHQMFRGGI